MKTDRAGVAFLRTDRVTCAAAANCEAFSAASLAKCRSRIRLPGEISGVEKRPPNSFRMSRWAIRICHVFGLTGARYPAICDIWQMKVRKVVAS